MGEIPGKQESEKRGKEMKLEVGDELTPAKNLAKEDAVEEINKAKQDLAKELEKEDDEFSGIQQKIEQEKEADRILFRVGYKAPLGKTFHGRTYSGRIEDPYNVHSKKQPHTIEGVRGKKFTVGFGDLRVAEGSLNKMYVRPAEKWKDKWFGRGKKSIGPLTLKDIGGEGEEQLYTISIAYKAFSEGYADRRPMQPRINLFIKESLTKEVMEAIENNPDNFWRFIEAIIPGLLEVWPALKSTDKQATEPFALDVYTSDMDIEFDEAEKLSRSGKPYPIKKKSIPMK